MIPLSAWEISAPITGTFTIDSSTSPPTVHQQCASITSAGIIYLAVIMSMLVLLILVLVIISVLVRNVPSEFNESKGLGLASYVCMTLLVVMVGGSITLYGSYQRTAFAILLLIGIWLNTTSMLSFLIGHKMFRVWTGTATSHDAGTTYRVGKTGAFTATGDTLSGGTRNRLSDCATGSGGTPGVTGIDPKAAVSVHVSGENLNSPSNPSSSHLRSGVNEPPELSDVHAYHMPPPV